MEEIAAWMKIAREGGPFVLVLVLPTLLVLAMLWRQAPNGKAAVVPIDNAAIRDMLATLLERVASGLRDMERLSEDIGAYARATEAKNEERFKAVMELSRSQHDEVVNAIDVVRRDVEELKKRRGKVA